MNDVGGDLSDGQQKFRAGLSSITLQTPTGPVKLDQNRQAIVNNFVTEVIEGKDGNLVNKVVKIVPDVRQTLGIDPAVFAAMGAPTRDGIKCKNYK